MAFLYETTEQGSVITGYDAETAHLQIPEEAGGFPVRGTAPWAFAHREDLITASLPSSLRTLERFSFYGCRNLQKVLLHDGITDLGDGVFRQCRSLRDFELYAEHGGCGILREILMDTDTCLRFLLHLPQGTACLTFPDYLAEYEEDTRARAMHYHIEGIGFSFRECVRRSAIDFRSYDRLFARIRMLEERQAIQIAMDRLLFPYDLSETAKGEYEEYIRQTGCAVIRLAIDGKQTDWVRLLTAGNLLHPEAIDEGIALASTKKEAEIASILMQAAPRQETGSQFIL